MFVEFGFPAHQTRLISCFILSAFVGLQVVETKKQMFGAIGGVVDVLMKLVLLLSLFCYIRSVSTVAPAKVGTKQNKMFYSKYDEDD